ncbi:uncharacterized protein LOC144115273 isoform X1 [Amblyomma americanum]
MHRGTSSWLATGRAQDGSARFAGGSAGGAARGVPGLQRALGAGGPASEPQARAGLLLRAVRQPGAARGRRQARLQPAARPAAALGLTGRDAGPLPLRVTLLFLLFLLIFLLACSTTPMPSRPP